MGRQRLYYTREEKAAARRTHLKKYYEKYNHILIHAFTY